MAEVNANKKAWKPRTLARLKLECVAGGRGVSLERLAQTSFH